MQDVLYNGERWERAGDRWVTTVACPYCHKDHRFAAALIGQEVKTPCGHVAILGDVGL